MACYLDNLPDAQGVVGGVIESGLLQVAGHRFYGAAFVEHRPRQVRRLHQHLSRELPAFLNFDEGHKRLLPAIAGRLRLLSGVFQMVLIAAGVAPWHCSGVRPVYVLTVL
ncbi:hypothetical protein KHO49_16635 [Pseudomonas sp. RC4D1]|uniref:hypothetical protein n=1 Tax=Pseudomonas sp. RC4D1 TaxID=2834407 RepID=UPI001BCE1C09|nr:hypothetical protein [Pseudomonas sp. RC4D1]MBS7559971.1 hypothetical protein [Pseudomonas sp. RC4D1]